MSSPKDNYKLRIDDILLPNCIYIILHQFYQIISPNGWHHITKLRKTYFTNITKLQMTSDHVWLSSSINLGHPPPWNSLPIRLWLAGLSWKSPDIFARISFFWKRAGLLFCVKENVWKGNPIIGFHFQTVLSLLSFLPPLINFPFQFWDIRHICFSLQPNQSWQENRIHLFRVNGRV